MKRLAALSGSLRQGSLNRALIEAVSAMRVFAVDSVDTLDNKNAHP